MEKRQEKTICTSVVSASSVLVSKAQRIMRNTASGGRKQRLLALLFSPRFSFYFTENHFQWRTGGVRKG